MRGTCTVCNGHGVPVGLQDFNYLKALSWALVFFGKIKCALLVVILHHPYCSPTNRSSIRVRAYALKSPHDITRNFTLLCIRTSQWLAVLYI